MSKHAMTRIFWTFALLALLSGCAAGRQDAGEPPAVALRNGHDLGNDWLSPQDRADRTDQADPAVGAMFRKIADTALGAPYSRGGTTMSGFDCSGFVQWTYGNMGITLPRTAREQSRVGRTVSDGDLRIGDIVTFRHPRRGWHSGIYMGDDQFVHSPSRRQRVRYSSMSDPYFRDTFVAARRVVQGATDLDFESANRRLALAGLEKRLLPEDPAPVAVKKGRSKGRTGSKARVAGAGGKKTGKAVAAGARGGKTGTIVAAGTGKKKPARGARIGAGKKNSPGRSVSASTGRKKTSPRKG